MTKLLIIGHARHGKDTVGEFLRDKFGVAFGSSSHFVAETAVRPYLAERHGLSYPTLEECYADRVNHRSKWFDAIGAYNTPDKTRLARAVIETSDVYIGMRCATELTACKNTGVFDAVIWVDRSKHAPPEHSSSCTVQPWMADFVLDNNGTLEDLAYNLEKLLTGSPFYRVVAASCSNRGLRVRFEKRPPAGSAIGLMAEADGRA